MNINAEAGVRVSGASSDWSEREEATYVNIGTEYLKLEWPWA